MELKIVKKGDASIYMEGPEVCRLYYKTDKITFGSSELLPGQCGAVDTGHMNSHEVFFVVKGHLLLKTEKGIYHELHKGDAILIPPSVPHEFTNIGTEPAWFTWSLAPSEV